eukprot:TRINITY_DN55802_c0_g1_i1.p2 TRINITY_DN55802_c0_g1~~TRINITY_DN55802_c0_g1_i1.p2  ORF type:complete len:301 (+),score=72.35 TRINITY_DN55802_c0_g1_i1:78-905(+)
MHPAARHANGGGALAAGPAVPQLPAAGERVAAATDALLQALQALPPVARGPTARSVVHRLQALLDPPQGTVVQPLPPRMAVITVAADSPGTWGFVVDPSSLCISTVTRGSAAHSAGLADYIGWQLTHVNCAPVECADDLLQWGNHHQIQLSLEAGEDPDWGPEAGVQCPVCGLVDFSGTGVCPACAHVEQMRRLGRPAACPARPPAPAAPARVVMNGAKGLPAVACPFLIEAMRSCEVTPVDDAGGRGGGDGAGRLTSSSDSEEQIVYRPGGAAT